MIFAAIACNCCAAILFFLGAVKYGRGPVPVTYHRLILEQEGKPLSPHQTLILTALYRALAGAMLAIGLLIVALSLGPIRAGALWAESALLLAGAAFVSGSAVTPYRVEQITGVQTPWRLSLVIGGLLVAGFVLAQLA